jgi:hypothetical protein
MHGIARQHRYRVAQVCVAVGDIKIKKMMLRLYGITVQDSLIFRRVTPGTFLQYARAARITKSAQTPP